MIMTLIEFPSNLIGKNVYHRSITVPREVKIADLKEIPEELNKRWLYITLGFYSISKIDDKGFLAEELKISDWKYEELMKLMVAQFVKENYPIPEYEAVIEGKEHIFYVRNTPICEADDKIGEVTSWDGAGPGDSKHGYLRCRPDEGPSVRCTLQYEGEYYFY